MNVTKTKNANGDTHWNVPNWFVHLIMWAVCAWVMAITTTSIWCYSQLSVGSRFTGEQGAAMEGRVTKLETTLPPSWLVRDVEELKAINKTITQMIAGNRDLIMDLRVDLEKKSLVE